MFTADSEVSGIWFSDEHSVFTILTSRYGCSPHCPPTMIASLMKRQQLVELIRNDGDVVDLEQ
jgi:hypothetical protein